VGRSGAQWFCVPRPTMASQPQSYPVFSGRVRHALDPKNRTTIPSNWRPEKPAPLWLVPQSDGLCLLALPHDEFRAVPAKVNTLAHMDPEERQDFIDLFFSEAQEVTPDSQGRFVIPQHFCEQLKLKDWVCLSGADSKFKIWNPDEFDRFLAERRTQTRSIGKQAQL
jgi:division/cell wall cluster transcriptional repressor MraZ